MISIRLHALLLISAIASCWRVLFTFWGVDDFGYVRLTIFPWPGWVKVFALRYFADYVLFAWHRMLFGLNPVWFHATLIALHLLNTYLVLTLLPKLGVRRRPDAIIAAFVFALHPTTYTVLNWVALGFEELGVATLTLVVLHVFVAYMDRPRVWLLIAGPFLMFIACGFKNLATLIPAWLAAAAAIIIFERSPGKIAISRAALAKRAILFILPTILVTVWYAVAVAPEVPQLHAQATPAYARDFSPSSVLRGMSVLMANLLNPLFVGRIGTGYQDSVPASLPPWGSTARDVLAGGIVSIVLVMWAITCWRTRRLVFGAAMLMVMIVALAPYSIMPLHLNDYATWPLPACAALWGMTIAEAYCSMRERRARVADWLSRPAVQAAGAMLLVSYAWVSGATLHGSNYFVRQARHAELIDKVARRAPDGGQIVFVPPSELAYTDTTYGSSIERLHPQKRLRVEYATTAGERSGVDASGEVVPLLLDAVPNGTGAGAWLYAIERAQWAVSGHVRVQRGRTLIQPFSTRAGRVREIHLLLDAFSDRCALQVDVFRSASTSTPARVAGGVMPCRGKTVTAYRSVLLDRPLEPNTEYALHVTATPNDPAPDGIRHGPLALAGAAWAPFRFDDEAAATTSVLAIRLISERWQ